MPSVDGSWVFFFSGTVKTDDTYAVGFNRGKVMQPRTLSLSLRFGMHTLLAYKILKSLIFLKASLSKGHQ
jgi:hypothetical protein